MAIVEKVKGTWNKTAGYKRTTAGVAIGILGTIILLFPDLMTEKTQNILIKIIEGLGATGVLDWVWRSRKNIIEFLKRVFTKKKKEN